MPNHQEPKIITGNANPTLGKTVTRRLSMHRGMNVGLVDARVERFNDGEIFVEVFENVRGEDISPPHFYVCNTVLQAPHTMRR